MARRKNQLLVLSCSQRKRPDAGFLPAVERYDGPAYRVLRSFLRQATWPQDLSVAVLSAKYGLVGGMAPIANYDQRMNRARAAELVANTTRVLPGWAADHDEVTLFLGHDYLPALDITALNMSGITTTLVPGAIGQKLNRMHTLLRGLNYAPRFQRKLSKGQRPLYFLPDWDDMLDASFDFEADRFSSTARTSRTEIHVSRTQAPNRLCDGVLVSLAQHFSNSSKGVLRRFESQSCDSLAPRSIRRELGLPDDHLLLGDCGAFSYVADETPGISVEQALAQYQLYDFDLGASVDHVPVESVTLDAGRMALSRRQRLARIRVTRENAEQFIRLHSERKYSFTPVGVIQALDANSYARQLHDYVDMGYNHIALGGLVPRSDKEIVDIVRAVNKAQARESTDIWLHLFGVFRPKVQAELQDLGIDSFDSATYLRKAWLRSDQNYLGYNGRWYAAIRVPVSADARTQRALESSGLSEEEIQQLERTSLDALHAYGRGDQSLEKTLHSVIEYDRLVNRVSIDDSVIEQYRRTLKERPWTDCPCRVCCQLGVDVLIFRGYNRNKRRGAHNTFMLYRSLLPQSPGTGGVGSAALLDQHN